MYCKQLLIGALVSTAFTISAQTLPSKDEWAWRGARVGKGCVMYLYTLGFHRDKIQSVWDGQSCNENAALNGVGTLRSFNSKGQLVSTATGLFKDGVWDGLLKVSVPTSIDPAQ